MTGLIMLRDELVERARNGDVGALEKLLVVCRPDLERYARRHCDSDDVEEAIQDALWILYRKVGGLRSAAAFAGWLFQVTRRLCRALARGRWRHVPLDAAPHAALRDSATVDPELRVMVTAAIAALPPPYRDVLLLRDVRGLSSKEAASALAISEEAARSRLHRARALVRESLAGQDRPEQRGATA